MTKVLKNPSFYNKQAFQQKPAGIISIKSLKNKLRI